MDSFGLAWPHSESLGLAGTHLGSLGLTWVARISTHLDPLAVVWIDLDLLLLLINWIHLDAIGLTWPHLDNLTRTQFDLPALAWIHWNFLQPARIHIFAHHAMEEAKAVVQKWRRGQSQHDIWGAFAPDRSSAPTCARHESISWLRGGLPRGELTPPAPITSTPWRIVFYWHKSTCCAIVQVAWLRASWLAADGKVSCADRCHQCGKTRTSSPPCAL